MRCNQWTFRRLFQTESFSVSIFLNPSFKRIFNLQGIFSPSHPPSNPASKPSRSDSTRPISQQLPNQREWFSGKILRCHPQHRGALGSIPSSRSLNSLPQPQRIRVFFQRNWFSGKILRCHPSNVGEPWVRFPDYALRFLFFAPDGLCFVGLMFVESYRRWWGCLPFVMVMSLIRCSRMF